MTRIPASIEVRFARIPARWAMRKERTSGEWMLVPEIDQSIEHKLTFLNDAWELRDQFFRMEHDEKSAFEFLNEVGVWGARAEAHVAQSEGGLNGWFGYREFYGRALPLTLEHLWNEQDHWNTLLRKGNEARLHAEFGMPPGQEAPPFEKSIFASKTKFMNTLPLHLAWHRDGPRFVIQPIMFSELLIATTQVDIATDALFQVCQRSDCGISFTGRRRKFCQWYCGHIESVRAHRGKEGKKKRAKRR